MNSNRFKRVLALILSVVMTVVFGTTNIEPINASESVSDHYIGVSPADILTDSEGGILFSYDGDIADEIRIYPGRVSETTEGSKYMELSVDMVINNDKLNEVRDDLEQGADLIYVCSFEGEQDRIVDIGTASQGDLLTKAGEDLGDYTISRNGNLIDVTVRLDGESIYLLSNIAAGCDFNLKLSEDAAVKNIPVIKYLEKESSISIIYDYENPENPQDTVSYSLDKTSTVDGNSINYVITAGADGSETASLSGKVIKDTAPDNIDFLEEVSVVVYNQNEIIDNDTLKVTDNIVEYKVKEYEQSVTKVELYINGVLSADVYEQYMSEGIKSIKVVNDAFLLESTENESGNENEILAEATDENTIFKNTEFAAKSGSQAGYQGHSFAWTITGNTYFSYAENVYVIDYIPDCGKHVFSDDKNITVNYEDHADLNYAGIMSDLGEMTGTQYSYEGLTINTILEMNIIVPSYYSYGEGAVMIVPLNSSALSGPFEITYYTDIINLTDDLTEGIDISNKARITWGSYGYNGTGGSASPVGIGEVNKTLYFRAIKKTGNNDYNNYTQTLSFDISVNECGQFLGTSDYTIVTDDITDEGMEYTGEISAVLKTIGGDGSKTPVQLQKVSTVAEMEATEFSYYISEDNKILKVNLADVDNTENYVITAQMKITAPEKLAVSGKGFTVHNSADICYGDETRSAEATLTYSNTWIKKESVTKGYDYSVNGNTWKVTVNPYKISLTDAQVTDYLPEHTSKILVNSIKENGVELLKDGSLVADIENANSGVLSLSEDEFKIVYEISDGKITIKFKGSNVEESYTSSSAIVIEYTTVYDEEYRQSEEMVVDGADAINKVVFAGKHKGVDIKDNKGNDVTVTVKQKNDLSPVVKDCDDTVQDGNTALYTTNWTIEINRDATDFSSQTVIDEFKDNTELVEGTFKIYEASASSSGDLKVVKELDITEFENTSVKAGGFSFTINEKYSHTPLIVTYSTEVTEVSGVGTQYIVNAVVVKNAKKEMILDEKAVKETTYYSTVDSKGYASGTKLKYVETASFFTDDVKEFTPEDSKKLKDLTITLTPVKYEDGKWVEDTEGEKIRITNEENYSKFIGVKEDTLYKLTQSGLDEVYPDYTLVSGDQYVIFTDNNYNYPEEAKNIQILPASQMSVKVEFINTASSGEILGEETENINTDKNKDDSNNNSDISDKNTENLNASLDKNKGVIAANEVKTGDRLPSVYVLITVMAVAFVTFIISFMSGRRKRNK